MKPVDVITIKRKHEQYRDIVEMCDRPNPVTEHSDVLKDARELATIFETKATINRPLKMGLGLDGKCAITFRTLAEIVEAQDKAPILTENLAAIRTELDALSRRIGVHNRRIGTVKVNDEAVAACVTCEEVIRKFTWVQESPYPLNDNDWIKLRAAGHLAKRAVDLADKLKAKGGV